MKISARYIFLFLALLGTSKVSAQTFSYESLPEQQKALPVAKVSQPVVNAANKEPSSPASNGELERISQAFSNKKTSSQTNNDDSLARISEAFSASSKKFNEKFDQDTLSETSEEDIFIPEGELYRLNTPTADGSVRGGQAFVEVDQKGRMKKTTKIFLFYDEFKILNPNAKVPTCNVRFNILSTLDRKINQLDIKLVWPGLTTTLSFSNVLPC